MLRPRSMFDLFLKIFQFISDQHIVGGMNPARRRMGSFLSYAAPSPIYAMAKGPPGLRGPPALPGSPGLQSGCK